MNKSPNLNKNKRKKKRIELARLNNPNTTSVTAGCRPSLHRAKRINRPRDDGGNRADGRRRAAVHIDGPSVVAYLEIQESSAAAKDRASADQTTSV